MHPDDRRYVQQAVARAQRKNPAVSRELFEFVRDMLLLKYPPSASRGRDRAEQQRFVGKFQQVTAPVMAKGLEDTAFYVYNRLLSLNEVGDDADRFGVSAQELHRVFQERQARWPWALSALSTHDTKRSEDVRARLNVLSEMPEEWRDVPAALERAAMPATARSSRKGSSPTPTRSICSTRRSWGPGRWSRILRQSTPPLSQRMQAYMLKALHEAKVHTSWINPNQAYDEAVQQYVAQILDAQANARLSRRLPSLPAAHQPLRPVQLAGPDPPEDHRSRGAGHLPGHGAVGF